MTKKDLLLQIRTIDMRIRNIKSSLNELYAKFDKLSEDELKLESKLLMEVASLRKIRREYVSMEPSLENELLPSSAKKAELKVSNKEKDKNAKDKDAFSGKNLFIGSVALLTVMAIAALCAKNCKKGKETANLNTPAAIEITVPYSPTFTSEAMPTVTPEIKAMFSDVTSEEELIERAKLIYDIDLKPILDELGNEQLNNYITEERLIDMLRLELGELPLHSEYDDNSIDEMYQFRTEVFGNLGSDPNLTKLYPAHYALQAPDNSELSEYMASYDELYNNIAEARNNGDMESAIKNIEALGKKHYNEFVLAGLYGDFNPYLLDSEYRQLAFAAADERYASYVLEYILDNNLTICVPACYDPVTGEFKDINVVDIEEALVLGTSMNGKVSLSYYGNAQDVNLPREFYYNLAKKLDGKVLKRG